MTFLVLDTSGEFAVLALATEEGNVQVSVIFEGRRSLSRRLMGQIEGLLKSQELALNDLTAFAVGIGPGSFTGVRVGVTTAKTLAQVTGKPLVGVGTLDAYAAAWEDAASAVVVPILPSRRGEVYGGVFQHGQPRTAPFAERLDALSDRLDVLCRTDTVIVCGDIGFLPAGRYQTLRQSFAPPDGLARLAAWRLSAGLTEDPLALVPLYVVAPSISTPKPTPGAPNFGIIP